MAPVKKFAITMTSLTALALVMSACAGNLEAKKLGLGNTGVLGKTAATDQALIATEDGTDTFNENCAAGEELQTKSESEKEISVAELIDGKSNKYVLERSEVIRAELDKTVSPATAKVIAAKGQGESVAIICHNSKTDTPAFQFDVSNPLTFDSNDGSATQSRIFELVTANGKLAARTFIVERQNNLSKIEEIKKAGGESAITKDASGTIRIRTTVSVENEKTFVHSSQLLVYKIMTADQAAAVQDENAAQAAADAVAQEAGVPTETPAVSAQDDQQSADADQAKIEEAQRKLNERMRQQSEELARKQQEQVQAEMDRRAEENLAKMEAKLRPKLPPCTVSSADAPCPNDGRQAQMALAAAQYRAQQEMAAQLSGATTTTTSTTQPTRTNRPADAIDYTSPGSYPR